MTDQTNGPDELSPLQHWMRVATAEESEQLAQLAGTSRDYLWQLGAGTRNASATLAGRIAREAARIRDRSPRREQLPLLTRTSLSPACAVCEYALACEGGEATRGAFPTAADAVRGRAASEEDAS